MLRRYTEQIRSDSSPDVVYDVIVEVNGTNERALTCTCPDDAYRGQSRPCKHRKRAELAPAFRRAQQQLLASGRVPGHVANEAGAARFAVLFRVRVDALVDRGVKRSDAVFRAIKDVIRAARSLPGNRGGDHV